MCARVWLIKNPSANVCMWLWNSLSTWTCPALFASWQFVLRCEPSMGCTKKNKQTMQLTSSFETMRPRTDEWESRNVCIYMYIFQLCIPRICIYTRNVFAKAAVIYYDQKYINWEQIVVGILKKPTNVDWSNVKTLKIHATRLFIFLEMKNSKSLRFIRNVSTRASIYIWKVKNKKMIKIQKNRTDKIQNCAGISSLNCKILCSVSRMYSDPFPKLLYINLYGCIYGYANVHVYACVYRIYRALCSNLSIKIKIH